jgi:hypothetical protein
MVTPVPPLLKLLTGLGLSFLVAGLSFMIMRNHLLQALSAPLAGIMARHGVTDGRVDWRDAQGNTWRIARLAGTASPATRAAILAEARAVPGIADARWQAGAP